jgi:hypothetical protein
MSDMLGNLAGGLLEPLKDAERILAEAMEKLGEGVQWTGGELGELSDLLDSLAGKVAALQAKLRGGQ